MLPSNDTLKMIYRGQRSRNALYSEGGIGLEFPLRIRLMPINTAMMPEGQRYNICRRNNQMYWMYQLEGCAEELTHDVIGLSLEIIANLSTYSLRKGIACGQIVLNIKCLDHPPSSCKKHHVDNFLNLCSSRILTTYQATSSSLTRSTKLYGLGSMMARLGRW